MKTKPQMEKGDYVSILEECSSIINNVGGVTVVVAVASALRTQPNR